MIEKTTLPRMGDRIKTAWGEEGTLFMWTGLTEIKIKYDDGRFETITVYDLEKPKAEASK